MSQVHSLVESLLSPDEKKEIEKLGKDDIKKDVSGKLKGAMDSVIMKVGDTLEGATEEKKDEQPKSIKEKYKVFKCSICNEECKPPYYKCSSENDTCREIHICQSCKDNHKPNHKLVPNDKEIHRYYSCDTCDVSNPIVGKRYNCYHPECKNSNRDYCELGCYVYHRVHKTVLEQEFDKFKPDFDLRLKKRKLKDSLARIEETRKAEEKARQMAKEAKKKKAEEAKKKGAAKADDKEEEAKDDDVQIEIKKDPLEEEKAKENEELLSLKSVVTYDLDKEYDPKFKVNVETHSESVQDDDDYNSDEYDYYDEEENEEQPPQNAEGGPVVKCNLCKIKITADKPKYKCLLDLCEGNIYCEDCHKSNNHKFHHVFDTKDSRSTCDMCGDELSKDPEKFYNCIECNWWKFCESCAQEYRCDNGHPLVTHALYKKIVKESDFGLLCRYNKDFLDEIEDICDEEWKKRNDKLDAERKKRQEKLEQEKQKWLKENPNGDWENHLKEERAAKKNDDKEGMTKGNEADEDDSESDSSEEDENDDKLFDEEFKTYLKQSKKDRDDMKKTRGYRCLIREVIFMLSPETFNSIQELTQDAFDFKELFFLRLRANLTIYNTAFKRYRWGGWEFDKCDTLKDYYKKDKLMKIHFSVGVSHVKDDFAFDTLVHGPTFFCFFHRQIGPYAHHLHGHIKVGDSKPRKDVFNLKISKCKFCKKKHFHIPLSVVPDACGEDDDGNGAPNSGGQDAVSDADEEEENEDPEDYDEGDEGEEEPIQPENSAKKEYLKIAGKRFIRPYKRSKENPKEYLLVDGKKVPEDIGFWMRLCVFPSYLKGTNFTPDTTIKKKESPPEGIWKFLYFLDITHNIHIDTRLFTLRFLWIIILAGMIMGVFTLPLDLFILIIYLGYPNAEKLAITENFHEKGKYFYKLIVLGVIFGAYWGLFTIEGIIKVTQDTDSNPFYLAFADLTVISLIAEVLILSIGTAKMNRSGIDELKQVKEKVDAFYSKLDIKTSVLASSECTKVKAERSEIIMDLSILEVSSSFGLVLNACILGLGIYLGKSCPQWLQTFFVDNDALLSNDLLGEGDSQWFYLAVMYTLLGLGLLALVFKVIISFFITMQSDDLCNEIDTAAKILEYAQKHPDPIISTEEVFKSQLTHETKVNLKLIQLKADKMGLKYSHESRKVTDMVLRSVLKQILDDTGNHIMTLKELKDKITETCHMSEVRIKHVETELKDLTAAIQYKFLGYWKVDKNLVSKLSAMAGAFVSAGALALINGKSSPSGGNGGNNGTNNSNNTNATYFMNMIAQNLLEY